MGSGTERLTRSIRWPLRPCEPTSELFCARPQTDDVDNPASALTTTLDKTASDPSARGFIFYAGVNRGGLQGQPARWRLFDFGDLPFQFNNRLLQTSNGCPGIADLRIAIWGHRTERQLGSSRDCYRPICAMRGPSKPRISSNASQTSSRMIPSTSRLERFSQVCAI